MYHILLYRLSLHLITHWFIIRYFLTHHVEKPMINNYIIPINLLSFFKNSFFLWYICAGRFSFGTSAFWVCFWMSLLWLWHCFSKHSVSYIMHWDFISSVILWALLPHTLLLILLDGVSSCQGKRYSLCFCFGMQCISVFCVFSPIQPICDVSCWLQVVEYNHWWMVKCAQMFVRLCGHNLRFHIHSW